jgi:hypothetical protein
MNIIFTLKAILRDLNVVQNAVGATNNETVKEGAIAGDRIRRVLEERLRLAVDRDADRRNAANAEAQYVRYGNGPVQRYDSREQRIERARARGESAYVTSVAHAGAHLGALSAQEVLIWRSVVDAAREVDGCPVAKALRVADDVIVRVRRKGAAY